MATWLIVLLTVVGMGVLSVMTVVIGFAIAIIKSAHKTIKQDNAKKAVNECIEKVHTGH